MELIATNEIKPEPRLEINAFSRTDMSVGLKALATRVINLLLQEKGTVSNCFDMGVGLGMYLFEFMSDSLISTVQSEINNQVGKYLPEVQLQGVQVERGDQESADTARSLMVKMSVLAGDLATTDLYFVFTQRADGVVIAEAYV